MIIKKIGFNTPLSPFHRNVWENLKVNCNIYVRVYFIVSNDFIFIQPFPPPLRNFFLHSPLPAEVTRMVWNDSIVVYDNDGWYDRENREIIAMLEIDIKLSDDSLM